MKHKATYFKLIQKKSKIHGRGVYAGEDIPKNKRVVEYTGEKIDDAEADRRTELEEKSGLVYLFYLDDKYFIDGNVGGSIARFVNHSCDPNLDKKRENGKIFYYSSQNIKKGEELTVDYCFDKDDEKTICHCGRLKCRGFINEV